MGTCLKVLCFCILIALTVQEKSWKLRRRRGVNPTDVKPQDIVEHLSRELKNVGSKANRVESAQVSEAVYILFKLMVLFQLFCLLRC